MTPVFCCGFECGQFGTVGQHWSLINGSFNTTASFVRSGSRSYRSNATAAVSFTISNTSFTGTIHVLRVYIYFSTLPNSNCELTSSIVGGSQFYGAMFKQSDSKIYAGRSTGAGGISAFGAAGVLVTTGQWYLIDVKVNVANNPTTVDVSVDGVAATQYTNAVVGATFSDLRLGTTLSTTADIYYDDFILSQTSADYPIGAGYVNHFIPTSDGTHTSTGTLITEDTIASPSGGTAIIAGTTTAFGWVNGVPLLGGATDNTRLINNEGTTTALYVEEIFGAAPGILTPTSAPRAVEVITADRQAATGVGVFSTKLNDNGTESTIINRTGAGVITDRFATKQYATAPTGGAWTVVSGNGNFNNIRARFGYSSDANPDQYWRGIMIEAEFAPLIIIGGFGGYGMSMMGAGAL